MCEVRTMNGASETVRMNATNLRRGKVDNSKEKRGSGLPAYYTLTFVTPYYG